MGRANDVSCRVWCSAASVSATDLCQGLQAFWVGEGHGGMGRGFLSRTCAAVRCSVTYGCCVARGGRRGDGASAEPAEARCPHLRSERSFPWSERASRFMASKGRRQRCTAPEGLAGASRLAHEAREPAVCFFRDVCGIGEGLFGGRAHQQLRDDGPQSGWTPCFWRDTVSGWSLAVTGCDWSLACTCLPCSASSAAGVVCPHASCILHTGGAMLPPLASSCDVPGQLLSHLAPYTTPVRLTARESCVPSGKWGWWLRPAHACPCTMLDLV